MSLIDNMFLLGWFFTEVLMIGVLNIYLIAHYAHPNDTSFGSHKLTRFVCWIGFTIVYIPILLVHLDFDYYKNHPDYKNPFNSTQIFEYIWIGAIMLQSIFVWIICPLAIVFYSANERLSFHQRLIRSIKT